MLCSFFATSLFAAEDFYPLQMTKDERGNAKKIIEDDKGVLSLILENDLFSGTGTDRAYTSGTYLSYTSPEEGMPSLIKKSSDFLPLLNREGKKRISVAFGQKMYTPTDVTTSDPAKDDFPYAGFLYGSLGIISDSGEKFDNAALTVGIVGPSAQAEQSQKFVHKIIGSRISKGWDHQLKDEPIINLSYERKWREVFAQDLFGVGFDVMPHLGANLGNLNTSGATGLTFRFGRDLPADYGPPRIRPNVSGSDFFIPTQKISGYLFSSAELRAVAHDIFLDGNTFKESNQLDKKIIVGSFQFGGTLIYKDTRLSYTHVITTRQFKTQKGNNTHFGGITLSHRF